MNNAAPGFPNGCPLPPLLKDEILLQTSQREEALKLCEEMGPRSEPYRRDCYFWKIVEPFRK